MANVTVPTSKSDADLSEQSRFWILNDHKLMFGGFLFLGGRLTDRLGRRRLFGLPIAA